MGLSESLFAAVGQFGGSRGDDYDDDPDDYRPYQRRERAERPLSLVQPARLEFSVVAPQDFDDAQQIADRLKAGSPVVVDLQACGRDLAKRLIDFCSGLAYARDGRLQLIGEQVVLVVPPDVELSSATGDLQERPFFNQT
jgi:cell division inhibitor SepF